jgi:hypothetical protein
MKRSIFAAITALGLALLPSSIVAQQGALRQQLVGTWTLVSEETTAQNGTKKLPYGPNPRGILIFDASGRYATVMLYKCRACGFEGYDDDALCGQRQALGPYARSRDFKGPVVTRVSSKIIGITVVNNARWQNAAPESFRSILRRMTKVCAQTSVQRGPGMEATSVASASPTAPAAKSARAISRSAIPTVRISIRRKSSDG